MIGRNDYPWPAASCTTLNPFCRYTYRQCVDFCAWRMVNDLHLPCYHWGNGSTWAGNARAAGFAVDNHPQPHDIAQFSPGVQGAGYAGHVGFVLEVGAGAVLIEDYNFGYPSCSYHQHVVGTGGVNFIHLESSRAAPQAPPPPPPPGDPMWLNRRVKVIPGTTDGYELDGWGGLHPVGSMPLATVTGYWAGWNIARDLEIKPDGSGGYVMDGFGGLHPFAARGAAPPQPTNVPYWDGWDIANQLIVAGWGVSPNGWIVDDLGGMHPFGGAPALVGGAYFPGGDHL